MLETGHGAPLIQVKPGCIRRLLGGSVAQPSAAPMDAGAKRNGAPIGAPCIAVEARALSPGQRGASDVQPGQAAQHDAHATNGDGGPFHPAALGQQRDGGQRDGDL